MKKILFGALLALAFLAAVPAHAGPTALPTTPQGAASGGAKVYFNDAVTTAVQVKATVGQLYSLSLTNTTAATAYLQVFCKPSASVTLGTTAPDFVVRLKTNAGAGDERDLAFPVGVCSGGTGLTIAGTTTATGSTTAAVSVMASYF